jgi:hypothetical protein
LFLFCRFRRDLVQIVGIKSEENYLYNLKTNAVRT